MNSLLQYFKKKIKIYKKSSICWAVIVLIIKIIILINNTKHNPEYLSFGVSDNTIRF